MPEKYKEKKLTLQSKKHIVTLFQGAFQSHFHGKGIEFRDFREYHPDDDAKYIDWTVSSREGDVIMRRYREEKQGNILSVIDISENVGIGLREKIRVFYNMISLVGNSALSTGDNFGAYIFSGGHGNIIPANKKRENIAKILQEISRAHNPDTPDFSSLLGRNTKKSILFYLTDRTEIEEEKYRALALKHDVIYVQISSHFENTLEGKGIQHLRDEGNGIYINLDDLQKKQLYRQKRQQQMKALEKKLQKLGISFIALDERDDIYVKLLYLIQNRQGNRYL